MCCRVRSGWGVGICNASPDRAPASALGAVHPTDSQTVLQYLRGALSPDRITYLRSLHRHGTAGSAVLKADIAMLLLRGVSEAMQPRACSGTHATLARMLSQSASMSAAAASKAAALEQALKTINSKFGKGTVQRLGDMPLHMCGQGGGARAGPQQRCPHEPCSAHGAAHAAACSRARAAL